LPRFPRRRSGSTLFGEEIPNMLIEMERFVLAHDRYLALDLARTDCSTPAQREFMHIQILEAYLEVQYRARHIANLQFIEGNAYVDQN
jgi:hypothetical protein